MSEDFQTTAPAVQQSPADTATEAAIDAVVTNAPAAQTEAAFTRASVEHRRSAPPDDGTTPGLGWRDGNEPTSLAPMPAAPMTATSEVDAAITKLNAHSGGHSELVASWGSREAVGEQLAYAKAAFKSLSADRPELIEAVQRSGLGDHPSVLEHLAQFGRQEAGRLGDFTIARNHNNNGPTPMPTFIPSSPPSTRAGPSGNSNNNGSLETQGELNRLLASNPPGSQGYKTNAPRIQQLYRTLAGSGSIIGTGGRTS